MLRTALLILSGNAAASLLLLARNLIVARMIPVADYGIAATFALAMAVVEMASAFGLQQQIVQSKDGDDPRFQAALQGFQLLRGVASGAILFLLAGPLARFMGIPEVIWAYQVLAIVPVLNALVHFDIHRLNRQMRYGPLLMTGAMPAVAALALVWPLSVWFGDWRVMLWSILAQAAITVLTSHLMAERPYRLNWDKAIISSSLRFGWPLLVNAMLMFAVFQGDKLIVGRIMGMEALAIFAMGMTLTLTPTLVMAKSVQNLLLPKLSRLAPSNGTDRLIFETWCRATLQISILIGVSLILLTGFFGAWLVSFLFGAKYAALGQLLVVFSLMNGIRIFKSGPAIIALSSGHTANSMIANTIRVAALPLGWMVLQNGGTILDLLWIAVFAEALGFILSLVLIMFRPGINLIPLWPMVLPLCIFLSTCTGLLTWPASTPPGTDKVVSVIAFCVLLVTMRRVWWPLLKRFK